MEGCEDEFGRVHLGQMLVEDGFPWCWGDGEVGCGGGHGGEEGT